MKETRLGPRQWAFVVVAGGAVLALPFTQRQSRTKPEPPVVDVAATLLPEVNLPVPSVMASTASHGAANANARKADDAEIAAATADAFELANAPALPAWPALPHSPFDDLVQQKAVVIEAQPTEEIVPMQPLRPWISAPGLVGHSLASTPSPSDNPSQTSSLGSGNLSSATSSPAIRSAQNPVAVASPWRDDGADDHEASQQVVNSYGHGRRQLPVTAGPADQYTYEELAQKLNLPQREFGQSDLGKQDLGKQDLGRQNLVSAIVPADQVLPVLPVVANHSGTQPGVNSGASPGSYPVALAGQSSLRSVPKSSVVLSRQPGLKPPAAQIHFGQTESQPLNATASSPAPDSPMVPLPSLPEERRGHMIFQPRRP